MSVQFSSFVVGVFQHRNTTSSSFRGGDDSGVQNLDAEDDVHCEGLYGVVRLDLGWRSGVEYLPRCARLISVPTNFG